MKMVQLMMKDYMEAGLFKQALDGKGWERISGNI